MDDSFTGISLIPIALCGPLGLFVLWDGLRTLRRVLRTRTWPHVEGHIVYAGSEKVATVDLDELGYTSFRSAYRPLVVYEYAVGETSYRGTEIRAGLTRIHPRTRALEKARQYRDCTAVYYSPDDPSRAVLDTGVEPRDFLPIGVGIGIIALGLWPLL